MARAAASRRTFRGSCRAKRPYGRYRRAANSANNKPAGQYECRRSAQEHYRSRHDRLGLVRWRLVAVATPEWVLGSRVGRLGRGARRSLVRSQNIGCSMPLLRRANVWLSAKQQIGWETNTMPQVL